MTNNMANNTTKDTNSYFYKLIESTFYYISYYVPYAEYFCFRPKNINMLKNDDDLNNSDNSDSSDNLCTLLIVNKNTKESVYLNNIEFNHISETVSIFENDTKDEYPLVSIVKKISDILKWNPNEHIIIASSGYFSYSYGVEYYCVKNVGKNATDICVKKNDNYVSVQNNNLKKREYDYFELINLIDN